MAGKGEPTAKGGDQDFRSMALQLSTAATCGCSCGHGQPAPGPVSPVRERLLHDEPERIADVAIERRMEVIARVLLPQARDLSRALAAANEQGTIGPGELQILSTLQCWLLQLQIELDELRLCRPPPLESK